MLFLLMVALMLALLAANRPLQAAMRVAVVALSAPVYHLVFRRNLTTKGRPHDLDPHDPAG